MKIFFLRLLIIITFQTFISVSYARETGYEVELIIFEDAKGRYLNSEDWSYNDMLNNTKAAPSKPIKADPEYKQLSMEGSKLTTNLERLKNNGNYRILTTRRWKQTGLDREHAFNISINDKTSEENEIDNNSISPQNSEPYVTGDVKLIMSRYLHFSVNLQYVRPQQTENSENGDINDITIPVVDERRMRSKEIHYIDHPLIGIVVLATPYKIKSTEKDTSSTIYKTM